ncbi:DUF6958 family protein [Pseudoroseicyclus sp. CXY001]|uniref:DUF6958 family protein n=1 Tax=Pseudoroseicyclus sp. CXY001 TaxID=3242492 RepID=UPI003570C0AF
MSDETIEIENVGQPGKTYRANRQKFEAMRAAVIKVAPSDPPGMTIEELKQALLPHLDETLFPGGEKAGWWIKAVHLDLEAKGVLARTPKPVRLYRT